MDENEDGRGERKRGRGDDALWEEQRRRFGSIKKFKKRLNRRIEHRPAVFLAVSSASADEGRGRRGFREEKP